MKSHGNLYFNLHGFVVYRKSFKDYHVELCINFVVQHRELLEVRENPGRLQQVTVPISLS